MGILTGILRPVILNELVPTRRRRRDSEDDIFPSMGPQLDIIPSAPSTTVKTAPTEPQTAAPRVITARPQVGGAVSTANPRQPQTANDNAAPTRMSYRGPAGGTFAQKAPWVMNNLMRDFGLKDYQAAAVLGNLGHESGGFTAFQEKRPLIPGSRGGWGWAQWTGPRRVAFEKWTSQNGLDPKSDEANYGFLAHELQTSHRGALENLKNTTNSQQALHQFEKDYEGSAIKAYGSRAKFMNQALDAYSKNPDAQQSTQTAQQTPQTQAAPQQARAPQSGNSPYMAIGDSLAYGVGQNLGSTKYAVSGYNPQKVNDLVQNAVRNGDVQGKHVILSGGASNSGVDPSMVDKYYPQMIQALKNAGASNVTVMGVGPYQNYSKYGYHDTLNRISQENGANYTGPLSNIAPFRGNSVQQQVHPSDYKPIVNYVRNQFTPNTSSTSVASSSPSPASTPTQPIKTASATPTSTSVATPTTITTTSTTPALTTPVPTTSSTTPPPVHEPAPTAGMASGLKPITTASLDQNKPTQVESVRRSAIQLLRPNK